MNATLTLVELIDLLADSTSTSPRVCELFLRELFTLLSQELISGNSVSIKNIGSFRVVEYKSRKKGKDKEATGKDSQVKQGSKSPHRWIVFTPAKSLAEAVNHPFAQFEAVILDDAVTDEQLAAIDERYPSVALASPIGEIETPTTPNEPSEDAIPPDNVEDKDNVEEPEGQDEPDNQDEPDSQDEPADIPPVERKPMLVGIPIDGPSHPVPERPPLEEPKTDEYFYRPALRDAYSPREEQLTAAGKRGVKWWMWVLPVIVLAAAILWLVTGHQGMLTSADHEAVPMDTAELYVEGSDVVTDTVTSQIVLSILAEKHYHSSWFWVYIYEENKDIIDDPDNVRPGTVVVIPPAEKYGIDAKDPASLKKAQRRSWEIIKLGKR